MYTVRQLRLEKGWNQNELAFHADLAPSVISQIETGKREPSATTLRKLSDALGVDVPDLFERVDYPKDQAPQPPEEEATGPPQVSREQLVAEGIPATDHEVEELNNLMANLWRLGRADKPVAYFSHDDVDTARIFMLAHLVLDTPSIVTPEAAGVVRRGMRKRLAAATEK